MPKKIVKESIIVDVIFPATSCSKQEISSIKKYLKNLGLIPRILFEKTTTPRKNSHCDLASFSAKARFEQLYEALKNPDSKLVWCARGGYSSGDLLPFLAAAKPITQNKMFIGFSDITSISTFLQDRWGWKTLCAPMLIQLIAKEDGGRMIVNKKSKKEILDLIFAIGKNAEIDFDHRLISLNKTKSKSINAEITGGCLSVLCGHFGGEFQIDFADKILFLEDVGESGEKLDRYFRQIIEVILKTKKKPQAIMLGEFCYGKEKDKFFKQNVDLAIKNLLTRIEDLKLEIPVFKDKEALGHSDKMRTLVLG